MTKTLYQVLSEGATNASHHFDAKDDKHALVVAHGIQNELRHKHGHDSYSGHLGTASGSVFKGEKETEKHAEDHAWDHPTEGHQKWDAAHVYRITKPRVKPRRGHKRYVMAGWAAE